MAKQTITRNLSTNIGGRAMQEIREKGLSPVTGKQALETKGIEAVYTGEAKKSIDPFIDIENNYAKYIGRTPRILFQEQEEQLRELRAQNQGYVEIAFRGALKTVGKTLIHGAGGLSSILSTGIAAITTPVVAAAKGTKAAGEFFESLYDNAYYRALDKGVEKLDEAMPIYQTKAVQQASEMSWKKLTSAKFIVDDLFGGLAFLGGAAIGGFGIGAAAKSFAFTAKLMSKAKKIGKALTADDLLALAAKGSKREALTRIAAQSLLSGYEAGIQARQFREMAIEDYREKYVNENFRNPTDEEMAKFSDEITSAANGVFAVNFGMVTAENLIMLNKIFGAPLKTLVPKSLRVTPKLVPPSRFSHVLSKTFKTISKPVFEGSQEFAQELVNRAATEFVLAKYSPEGLNNNIGFFDYYGKSLAEMYGDESAWKEAYVGALMGLIGIPFVATGSVTEIPKIFKKPKASEFASRYHKYDTANVMKNSAANLARIFELTQNKEAAIANADMLQTKDKEAEEIMSWMNSRDNVGLLDEEIDTYLDTLNKMTDEEFKTQFEADGMTANDIKARKEALAQNLRNHHKNFVAAKKVANQIVAPEATDEEAGDLNEQITHVLFMSKNTQDRIDRITKEIEDATGLKLEADKKAKVVKDADGNIIEDGSLMSYFDEKGNLKKNAPDSLKKYLKDPNNYVDLFNSLKDKGILTKRLDAQSALIQKMYNVEFQEKLIDEMREMKFRMFDKFVNGVEISEKYNGYYVELKNAKQALEKELANEKDPTVAAEIQNDIDRVTTRMNNIKKALKKKGAVKDELKLLSKVIKVNLLDPNRKEYTQKIRKVKINTDISKAFPPSGPGSGTGGGTGGSTATDNWSSPISYFPGEDNPIGIPLKDGQVLTVMSFDSESRPSVYTMDSRISDLKFRRKYGKVKYDAKGNMNTDTLSYDDAVQLHGNAISGQVKREDFVSLDFHEMHYDELDISLIHFTSLNAARVEEKYKITQSRKTALEISRDNSGNVIDELFFEVYAFAQKNNELNERKALVASNQPLISTSTIPDAQRELYTYEIIKGITYKDGFFVFEVTATVKAGEEGNVALNEETFEILVPSSDFTSAETSEEAKSIVAEIEKVKEVVKTYLENSKNNTISLNNSKLGSNIEGFTIGSEAYVLVNGKYELRPGITILVVDPTDPTALLENPPIGSFGSAGGNFYIESLVEPGDGTNPPVFKAVFATSRKEAHDKIIKANQNKIKDNDEKLAKLINRASNIITEKIKKLRSLVEQEEGGGGDGGTISFDDFYSINNLYDDSIEITQEELLQEILELTEKEKDRAINRIGEKGKSEIRTSINQNIDLMRRMLVLDELNLEQATLLYNAMRSTSRLVGNLEYNFALGVPRESENTLVELANEWIIYSYNVLSTLQDPTSIGVDDLNYDIKVANENTEISNKVAYQEGQLIRADLVDAIIEANADDNVQTEFVNRVIMPEFLYEDGVVQPAMVETIEFTEDQIEDIINNPDKYRKTYSDLINERYEKLTQTPPQQQSDEQDDNREYGSEPGFKETNGIGYYVSQTGRVVPRSVDFLNRAELFQAPTEETKEGKTAESEKSRTARGVIGNIYKANENQLVTSGFANMDEMIKASEEAVKSLLSNKGENLEIGFIRAESFRPYYKEDDTDIVATYPQFKGSVKIDNSTEEILLIVQKVGDKLIPIGTVNYHDAYIDSNGVSLGAKPGDKIISPSIADEYANAYEVIKKLWDNSSADKVYFDNSLSVAFQPKKNLSSNSRVLRLVENPLVDRVYLMYGTRGTVYEAVKKDDGTGYKNKKVKDQRGLAARMREAAIDAKLSNSSLIMVEIGGQLYPFVPDMDLYSEESKRTHQANINAVINTVQQFLSKNSSMVSSEDIASLVEALSDSDIFGYSTDVLSHPDEKKFFFRITNNQFRYSFKKKAGDPNANEVSPLDINHYAVSKSGGLKTGGEVVIEKVLQRYDVKDKSGVAKSLPEYSVGIIIYENGIKYYIKDHKLPSNSNRIHVSEKIITEGFDIDSYTAFISTSKYSPIEKANAELYNPNSVDSITTLIVSGELSPGLKISNGIAFSRQDAPPPTDVDKETASDQDTAFVSSRHDFGRTDSIEEVEMFLEEAKNVVPKFFRVIKYNGVLYVEGQKAANTVYWKMDELGSDKPSMLKDDSYVKQNANALTIGFIPIASQKTSTYTLNISQNKVVSLASGNIVFEGKDKTTKGNKDRAIKDYEIAVGQLGVILDNVKQRLANIITNDPLSDTGETTVTGKTEKTPVTTNTENPINNDAAGKSDIIIKTNNTSIQKDDESQFSTIQSDEQYSQKDISDAKNKLAKIVPFQVEEMTDALQNLLNDGTAVGAFHKNVIYLLDDSAQYHEAFHGVFRTLMSVDEVNEVMGLAKQRYAAPTQEEIERLRNLTEHNKTLTTNQIIDLYYEEKLAEDFQRYMKTGESFFQRFWRYILDFIRLFSSREQDITAIFRSIEKGKYLRTQPRATAPYAFRAPAYANVNVVRYNNQGNPYFFNLGVNQAKDVVGMVAYNIFKNVPNLNELSDQDFMNAIKDSREQFNPIDWYRYFKDNNVTSIHSKMNVIVDYYNSLAVPGDTIYGYRFDEETGNGILEQLGGFDAKTIVKNNNQIIQDAKKLLKFYSGEVYTSTEENEESNDENSEPDEMIRKDSNKYGGLKSESQAFRLFIGLTTYDKKLFNIKGVSEDRTINMPVNAEVLYSKLKKILTNTKKEDFLSIIRFAARDNVEIAAFYNRLMAEINKEISIDVENEYVSGELSANPYVNSPTWNLMAKTFYQTSTDYLHVRTSYTPTGKQVISYYPNRFSQTETIYKNWLSSYKRLDQDKDQTLRNLGGVFDKLMLLEGYTFSDPLFEPALDDFIKFTESATGFRLNKAYVRYSLSIGKTSEVDPLSILEIEPFTTDTVIKLIDYVDNSPSGSLFNSDATSLIRRVAYGANYFDDQNTSFVLTNPEGEKIYTSIHHSYDTEIFSVFRNSIVDGEMDLGLLRNNLEELAYPEDIIVRFIEMAKYNYIFQQTNLTQDDFKLQHSYGKESSSYDKLKQNQKDLFKIEAYLSTPAQINANERRLFNPFVIAEKNTNKLIRFEHIAYGAKYVNGKFEIKDSVINIFENYLNIEIASVKQYEDDIRTLITGNLIESMVKGYHYNEYTVDGVKTKVVAIDGKYYALNEIWDNTTYKTHDILTGYNVVEIARPDRFKDPKGANLFQFQNIREQWLVAKGDKDAVRQLVRTWIEEKLQREVDEQYVSRLMMQSKNSTTFEDKDTDPKLYRNKALTFLVNDMAASMGFQYAIYGGSPIYTHKDFKDVTKRNSGVNANGPGIGNSETNVALINSAIETITDPTIAYNNNDLQIDRQDAQNYATALWYYSKYAKYKSVTGIKDIAMKIIAGIKLSSKELKTLEKNHMLLTDRKLVMRNTFLYDKTSVHIQAREAVSELLVSEENALLAWKQYLKNPSPEEYNRLIYPMYRAKPGFEYHHDMLNSMEAQNIHIVIADSASKNASVNVANNPKELRPFPVSDLFIKEQVKTDNLKTKILDPTQSMGLLWSEQSEEYSVYSQKYLDLIAYRASRSNNYQINKFFPGGKINYELIWDNIKDNISVNDPQLFELLSVEDGVPKYNWNLPNVNARIVAAFMASVSTNGLKQVVKGTKANLVSSYKYNDNLNWKFEMEQYPGVYFSEVYVTRHFLEKNGLKVGDIMWGTRIPTEDKYSMANLYIKGVIEGPYSSSIFLPKELMKLSGADHDLDSLYIKIMSGLATEEMFQALFDKNTTAKDIVDGFISDKEQGDEEIDVINDAITFLSMVLTHNTGNESIYATGNTIEPLVDSPVKSKEVEMESSVFFYDRGNAEQSNFLSKNGIGSSAVYNLGFQVMARYFPEYFPYTYTVDGETYRINKYASSHIASMADNPKYLMMAKYGLDGNNINTILILMNMYKMPYDKALAAVRDYNTITTMSSEVVSEMFNDAKAKMSEEDFSAYINDYINDGYTIEYDENDNIVNVYMQELSDYNYDKGALSKTIKEVSSMFTTVGTIIRLNRSMPSSPKDYYEVENSLRKSNIVIKRQYHKEGSSKYNFLAKKIKGDNFVAEGTDVYVKKDGEIVEINIKLGDGKVKPTHRMILEVIANDEVTKQNLAAYIAYSEFAKDAFIKFKPMFRNLNDRVVDLLNYQKDDPVNTIENMQNNINDYDIDAMIKNSEDYVMAALNAMAYVDQNVPIYTGVLDESLEDGAGYMEALSKKILSQEFIRLLYDVKYIKSENGKHIANIATINDDSGSTKLEYTNDYSNMFNSSKNGKVFNEFVQAANKQEYIDNMSLNDAKLLMSFFIFHYSMAKDAMMYTSTSFSKIIDHRLFVKYGKATAAINEAFTSISSFKKYYGTENYKKQLTNIANRIFNTMFQHMASVRGEKVFPIVKGYTIESIRPKPITFAYASPGLGKTTLAQKYPEEYVDLDAVVDEVIMDMTRNPSLGTKINSQIMGSYGKQLRERYGIDYGVLLNRVKSKLNEEHEGKIVLSTYDGAKITSLGYEYTTYYVPNISAGSKSLDNILDRLSKREKNPISKEELNKETYMKMYIQEQRRNNAIIVDDNLEMTIKAKAYQDYLKLHNSSIPFTYNNKEYILVGKGADLKIFDDKFNEVETINNDKGFTKAQIEFNVLSSKGLTVQVGRYLVSKDNRVYSIDEKRIIPSKDVKSIIDQARKMFNKGIATPKNTVKVVSDAYGVIVAETNPSDAETKQFLELIKPQIQAQATKENIGKNANLMFQYGLRWARVELSANPLSINAPNNNASSRDSEIEKLKKEGKNKTSSFIYAYHTLDQNGNLLPPISTLNPIIEKIQNTIGIDMSNYDAVIGNIYLPGQNISTHRDVTESESARNYPVIVYTIGAGNAINIYENKENPGKTSFASDSKIEVPTKNGTIYTFGVDGKGRFEMAHDTPKAIQKGETLEPIILPDGTVVKDYTITLTFRRAQDLEQGMDLSPKKINLKENPPQQTAQTATKSSEIYSQLSRQTSRGNVKIDEVAGRKPAVESKGSKPIVAYRTKGNNFLEALEKDNAIGNPWSSIGKSMYKTNTVKEAVEEFIAWMIGERHTDKLQDYRQAIIDRIPDLKGIDIIYYIERNEPSHATALDYIINEYFSQQQPAGETTTNQYFEKKNIFTVSPIQNADMKKAVAKASIATQYIGFAEGITGSSTALYGEQILKQTELSDQLFNPDSPKINIYAGTNENADLSNFANRPFMLGDGITYPTVEHAFQLEKLQYSDAYSDSEKEAIVNEMIKKSPAEVKAFGRTIKGLNIKEWEKSSSEVMKSLIRESFINNQTAIESLLKTGNSELTHKQDKGKWGKEFPKLLMEIRQELSNKSRNQIVNSGNYSSSDVIFVSVVGNRGSESQRKLQQDRTIREAIKAIEAGAVIVADNESYIKSNSYNSGEKRLAMNLKELGYNYSEVTINGEVLGVWSKAVINTGTAKQTQPAPQPTQPATETGFVYEKGMTIEKYWKANEAMFKKLKTPISKEEYKKQIEDFSKPVKLSYPDMTDRTIEMFSVSRIHEQYNTCKL